MSQNSQTTTLRRVSTALLASALAVALTPALAFAAPAPVAQDAPGDALVAQASEVARGACGNCTWTLDSDGQLVIAPTPGTDGMLADLSNGAAPWLDDAHRGKIKSAVFKPGVKANGGLVSLFSRCFFLESVDLSGLDTSRATSMASMFYSCSSLKRVSLAGLDTSNVTNMSGMFNSSNALEAIDLTGVDTSKVTNMSTMFAGCSTLASFDLTGFDTSNVTTMASMFSYSPFLTKLDLSSFDTSKVTDMTYMFEGCSALREVTLGEGFSFIDANDNPMTTLPSGNWLSFNEGITFTPGVVADRRGHVADTYRKMTVAVKEEVMFRLYNPNSGEHFYTSSTVERDHLIDEGWNSEGEGWKAPSTGDPVYRLYNSIGGEHHYTLSVAERDNLVKQGWNDEGIGWYSTPTKKVALFRQYNPNEYANNHNYTSSTVERDHLLGLGWQDEGVSWYGIG